MEIVFSDVGCRISERIKGLGLKQVDICNITGLSTTALSQYCTGKRVPDTVSLYKIATALGMSMERILTGEDLTIEEINDDTPNLEVIKREQGLSCDGSPLDTEEADLVAMYRLLPSHAQEDMFDQLHCLYRKYAERKRESIYWTYKADKLKQKDTAASDGGSQDGIA